MTVPNPTRKWLLVIVGSILLAGAATAALFAVVLATHTAGCTNTALGDRDAVTKQSAAAQRDFAAADRTYNVVIDNLIAHPARSLSGQARQRSALLVASTAKAAASATYYNAMTQIIATATTHPLGKC